MTTITIYFREDFVLPSPSGVSFVSVRGRAVFGRESIDRPLTYDMEVADIDVWFCRSRQPDQYVCKTTLTNDTLANPILDSVRDQLVGCSIVPPFGSFQLATDMICSTIRRVKSAANRQLNYRNFYLI